MKRVEFFDSHSHYNDEKFDSIRDKLIEDTYFAGVTKFICAGYDIPSSKLAVELAEKYSYIYAICGISPNDIEDIQDEDYNEIIDIARNKKVVAIGEIGLDYYWNKENSKKQKQAFIKQIDIANNLNLPIVIHTRDAIIDTIDILKNKINCINKGVFHCCPQNIELIKEALKLEFYISFAGPITFKNAKNADTVIKEVPMDRILIETDSPYLSPEPLRGTLNDSRNVKYVAEKIAKVKELSIEEVANKTYENAKKIFKIE